jgi:ribosomal-protein-alanine N-acetyltransferase
LPRGDPAARREQGCAVNARLQPQLIRRAMNSRDLDAVQAIEAAAYAFPWTRGNFIDSIAVGYLAEVLVEAGAITGYFVAMAGVDELHLLNITVAPQHQGRGLGSLMLDVVQDFGQRQGLSTLLLEVRRSNPRARALYLRRGFTEVGLRRDYYPAAKGREDALVMSLALGAHAHDLV